MYLYKYRSFNLNHIKALSNNEIWFSRGDFFNDPLDCTTDVPITLIDGKNYFQFAMKNTAVQYHLDQGNISKQNVISILHERLNEMQDIVENSQEADHPLSLLESMMFNVLKRTFVCCFAGSATNHLMWSHYADAHTGFCVRFRKDKLISNENIRRHGPVNYDGEPISIMSQLNRDKQSTHIFDEVVFQKSPEWSYEDEYRLTYNDYATSENDNFRQMVYGNDVIDCIFFGLRTKESDIIFIKRLFEGRNVKFKRIKRERSGFKLFVDPEDI